jgi:hypothetical protein
MRYDEFNQPIYEPGVNMLDDLAAKFAFDDLGEKDILKLLRYAKKLEGLAQEFCKLGDKLGTAYVGNFNSIFQHYKNDMEKLLKQVDGVLSGQKAENSKGD